MFDGYRNPDLQSWWDFCEELWRNWEASNNLSFHSLTHLSWMLRSPRYNSRTSSCSMEGLMYCFLLWSIWLQMGRWVTIWQSTLNFGPIFRRFGVSICFELSFNFTWLLYYIFISGLCLLVQCCCGLKLGEAEE